MAAIHLACRTTSQTLSQFPPNYRTLPSQNEVCIECCKTSDLPLGRISDSELRKEISTLGDRTSHLENKSDELCAAHNDVVDKLQKLSEDNNTLQLKLADLEDRSRRQNVRFRGVPDDISHDALPAFILSICKTLAPDLPDSAWTFDRIFKC
ncbi:Hypothetical predicted protein [Pelobates cultripes]|uniref:Uncharacterized protein n=1 Tax=Pelobates cultripes TaxID=61616 RepID=A0AAD1W0Q5_PELCU|nr:Hypothetical predicted protein [Pelobates cultripes]CAH2277001.1 Hypothetical predicted protein [Pelobates cultripes]